MVTVPFGYDLAGEGIHCCEELAISFVVFPRLRAYKNSDKCDTHSEVDNAGLVVNIPFLMEILA